MRYITQPRLADYGRPYVPGSHISGSMWETRPMTKGTVKWFNDAKGFGFIQAEGKEADIFVHYSAVKAEGFRSLNEGEEVEFELIEGDKGLKAENVTRVQA